MRIPLCYVQETPQVLFPFHKLRTANLTISISSPPLPTVNDTRFIPIPIAQFGGIPQLAQKALF